MAAAPVITNPVGVEEAATKVTTPPSGFTSHAGAFVYAFANVTVHAVITPLPVRILPAMSLPIMTDGLIPQDESVGAVEDALI